MNLRAQILDWAERGYLPSQHLLQALNLAQVLPDLPLWRKFLSLLMLATGTLLAGSGVIFFFAYNWNGLPAWVRFAMVELLLICAFAFAWFQTGLASRAALFFAALMTGALFALIGQTYQMGADPWQLFALWAALILPWAFAARQPDLWLLSLLLANVALGLRPWLDFNPTWILCAFNLAAQAIWEFVAPRPRLGSRIVGTAAAVSLTVLILAQILGSFPSLLSISLYILWLGTALLYFTRYRFDLLLVSAVLLSAIVALTSLCVRGLFAGGAGNLLGNSLLIALIVIALSGAAAKWLQHLAGQHAAQENAA